MTSRNWMMGISLLAVGAAIGGGVVWWWQPPSVVPSTAVGVRAQKAVKTGRPVLYWADPMNPKLHSNHFMQDAMGMSYVPVYGPGSGADLQTGLRIDPRLAQNLGVRLIKVERRPLGRAIHTVGTVAVDENRVYAVNPRFSGWVERLNVRAVGDAVRQGQVLAQIYAPALYSAQQEYLIARRQQKVSGGQALTTAAEEKLHLLGLSTVQIAALVRRRRVERDVPIVAPVSGVVTVLKIHQGSYVSPERVVYEIANLDRVWGDVALYSYQLPWVALGDPVRLHLPSYPGQLWKGRLDFLYPTLNPRSRTVTARLSIPNPGGVLRPGMYADADILARPRQALAVPSSAVLRNQGGDYVMLGESQGHFLPVQVTLGPEAGGWVEIRRGIKAGDQVVDNAQFLLYSESQFQSVRVRMLGGNTGRSQVQEKPTPAGQGNSRATPAPPARSGTMAGMGKGQGGHPHD
ncbi:MAG: efflux RND transporter periplasmic adaptor subunit [Acidiferrobacteraceae bacterium]